MSTSQFGNRILLCISFYELELYNVTHDVYIGSTERAYESYLNGDPFYEREIDYSPMINFGNVQININDYLFFHDLDNTAFESNRGKDNNHFSFIMKLPDYDKLPVTSNKLVNEVGDFVVGITTDFDCYKHKTQDMFILYYHNHGMVYVYYIISKTEFNDLLFNAHTTSYA